MFNDSFNCKYIPTLLKGYTSTEVRLLGSKRVKKSHLPWWNPLDQAFHIPHGHLPPIHHVNLTLPVEVATTISFNKSKLGMKDFAVYSEKRPMEMREVHRKLFLNLQKQKKICPLAQTFCSLSLSFKKDKWLQQSMGLLRHELFNPVLFLHYCFKTCAFGTLEMRRRIMKFILHLLSFPQL